MVPPVSDAASPAPNVPEPTEPSVDPSARYQARVALVTAIVALVSAILGPLVSLKINSDQIDSQRKQTIQQNEVDRKASESEFVRTERRAVYADYLAAYNNGAVDLTATGGRVTTPGFSGEPLAKEAESLIATLREVTAKYYAVSLLVSEDAQEEASTSYQLFAQHASELLTLSSQALNGSATNAQLQEMGDALGDRYAELLGSSEAFIEAARVDLCANDGDQDDEDSDENCAAG